MIQKKCRKSTKQKKNVELQTPFSDEMLAINACDIKQLGEQRSNLKFRMTIKTRGVISQIKHIAKVMRLCQIFHTIISYYRETVEELLVSDTIATHNLTFRRIRT